MATTEQQQLWLTEAEAALHDLMTGQRSVSVNYNGRSVTYSQADAAQLKNYILELQVALGQRKGRSRAITGVF